jgi:pimeloyl-ACP methyl ester carboxylesterase/DNA-binding CsgD family transcriptional regulator
MLQSRQKIRFCASRDGTRIAYATCGSGPPLVWVQHWIHHLELDWESPVWRPWLALLAAHHTVVRYDWRGCGLSDRERVQFSFEKHAEDLDAVIAAAGVERFVLFGMAGAGSAIAMSHAVQHPGRVTHLVLFGCNTRGPLGHNPTPEQEAEAQARLKVIELGWPNDNPGYGQFLASLHVLDSTAEQFRSYNDLLRRTTTPANAIGTMNAFNRMNVEGIVPKVRCPTLVIHPRGDAIIPFDQGRKVAALIPGAHFVPLDSRNRITLDTEPAWSQLVEAVHDFLPARSVRDAPSPALDELSARELEVLEVVAEGLDNHEIAARLNISEKTVRNHVSIIFGKLQIKSRAQAVALARDAGLGKRLVRGT